MKLFLDTANLDEIREGVRWGVLGGVTTNPTLIGKESSDFLPRVKEICSIVDGDVSIETVGDDTDKLISQGREIAQIADNAVVKIATTPNGLAATRRPIRRGHQSEHDAELQRDPGDFDGRGRRVHRVSFFR